MRFTINLKEFDVQPIPTTYLRIKSNDGFYDVFFQDEDIPFKILSQNNPRFVVIDKNVSELYPNILSIAKKHLVIEAIEENKTITTVMQIVSFLETNNFTKGDQLIAIGGGLIQDVVGFAAHIYKRGIQWIYFPTTLLSMADSCIGSKTGINTTTAKNQLGVFSHPQSIYINPIFLKTLPLIEIDSGMGEILKMCIIGGSNCLSLFQTESIPQLIKLSLVIKQAIIEEDEFEHLYRKTLNYGHTIGHALETLSGYRLTHGQAIIIGMYVINDWYENHLKFTNIMVRNIQNILSILITPTMKEITRNLDYSQLKTTICRDKKMIQNVLRFAVVRSPGNNEFYDCVITDELINEFKEILTHV
jgi:3-dehydroquinate synthase